MSPNTSNNSTSENKESTESVQTDSIKTQLYKEYAEHIVKDLDAKETYEVIDNYMNGDSFSGMQKNEILKFKGRYSKFNDLKSDEIEFYPIQNEFKNEYLKRRSIFQLVKKNILKNYNISSQQYSDYNIEGYTQEQDLEKLTDILKSPTKLDNFVKDFCASKKIDPFEKKSIKKMLEGISLKENFKEKLSKLSENDLKKVYRSMDYLNAHIGQSDFGLQFSEHIQTLLSLKVLTHTEVSDILKDFAPFIPLNEGVKINSSLNKKKIVKDQLDDIAGLNFNSLDNNTQEEIINSVKEDDIFIPIEELFISGNGVSKSSIDKIIKSSLLIEIGEEVRETITFIENEGGPQTYDSFMKTLSEEKEKVGNPEKFKKGNFIIIETIESKEGSDEKSEKTSYFKILSDGSEKPLGNISLASYGIGKFSSNETETAQFTYNEWINYIQKGYPEKGISLKKHSVITEADIKQKINTEEIIEDVDSSEFKTELDLQGYKTQRKNNKIKEIIDENSEYKDLSDSELENILSEKYPEFESDLNNELKEWNKNYIKTKLDDIDEDGKQYGFDIGVSVEFDTGEGLGYFTISHISPSSITIKQNDKNIETIDYEGFYRSFKEKDGKRVNKVNDGTELLNSIKDNDDIKSHWSGIKISDGGFLTKQKSEEDSNEKELVEYEYIECDVPVFGEYDIMKIHNISDGGVKVSYGKKTGHEKLKDKEAQEKKEEKEKKEGKKIIYNMSSGTQTIPLGVFEAYINKKGGIPKSIEEENSPEAIDDPESVERYGSLLSRYLKRASISDLIASGKMVFDSIESKLKEGTDEKAAKLVSELGWIPKSVKIDIDMRVEQASKKRMDEFKDRLGGMDSGKSTELVKDTLMNKDSPESMKEACIMFMAEKYGTLYEKGALHKYKGRFLRYEAFGGKIGDEMYRTVEKRAKKDGINFTEHELMINLLSQQCKDGPHYPKRRSKLHKEYKAMMGKGKDDEKAKGEKDASEKRTIDGRLFVAYDELEGGAYLNSMGALKSVVGKGDDGYQHKLNEIPFIMMTSGDAYNYDQDTVDSFKNDFLPNGHPLPAVSFISKSGLIDLYNNAVIEVCRLMKEDDPQYNNMYNEILSLTSNNKTVSSDDKTTKVEKIKESKKFYGKYGEKLCRIMNLLNTRSTDEIAKYEKLIWLEAKNGNTILKEYYDMFTGSIVGETDFAKDDDTITDAFNSSGIGKGGISGMNAKKVFSDMLQTQSGSSNYRMKKGGKMIEREMLGQLEAFKKIEYSSEKDRLDIVTDYIHGYFTAMIVHHGASGHFDTIFDNYKPMRVLGAKYEDFKGKLALDFENDTEETLAVSRKYARKWLGSNEGISDSHGFENIPRTVDSILN